MLNMALMVLYHLVLSPLLAPRLLPALIQMLPLRPTLNGLKNSTNNTGAVGVNISKHYTTNIDRNLTGYYNQPGAGQPVDNKGV